MWHSKKEWGQGDETRHAGTLHSSLSNIFREFCLRIRPKEECSRVGSPPPPPQANWLIILANWAEQHK